MGSLEWAGVLSGAGKGLQQGLSNMQQTFSTQYLNDERTKADDKRQERLQAHELKRDEAGRAHELGRDEQKAGRDIVAAAQGRQFDIDQAEKKGARDDTRHAESEASKLKYYEADKSERQAYYEYAKEALRLRGGAKSGKSESLDGMEKTLSSYDKRLGDLDAEIGKYSGIGGNLPPSATAKELMAERSKLAGKRDALTEYMEELAGVPKREPAPAPVTKRAKGEFPGVDKDMPGGKAAPAAPPEQAPPEAVPAEPKRPVVSARGGLLSGKSPEIQQQAMQSKLQEKKRELASRKDNWSPAIKARKQAEIDALEEELVNLDSRVDARPGAFVK